MSYDNLGVLDKWIVSKASAVFADVHSNFENYNFVQGMSLLNNFIVNDLSGIYIDVTKDRLYCDAQDDAHRRASQSAMAIITKALLGLIAPILTYTADEILESAPAIIREDAQDIFEYRYEAIELKESGFAQEYMMSAREKFFEIVDALKKEKSIKSTLELIISTSSQNIGSLDSVEAEDWFVVSGVSSNTPAKEAGRFEVDGDLFIVGFAEDEKCPRCWKYQAKSEDSTCKRCEEVVGA
jgi:isoleucyl-tRNA synthetase